MKAIKIKPFDEQTARSRGRVMLLTGALYRQTPTSA